MDVPKLLYKKILYPTDLSDTGRGAFEHAASLSNIYNAELTVFHVVEEETELSPQLMGYMNEALWEEIKERDSEEATRMLIERKQGVHRGVL